jgi:hypothetical protein
MKTLPEQIRAAAAMGDYTEASRLFDEHATALRDRALAGRLEEQDLRELFELVEWTRQTSLADRSQLEARVAALRKEAYASRAYAAPRE